VFRSGYRLWAWLVDKGLMMELYIKAACRLFVSEFGRRVLPNITSSFDSLDFCSHKTTGWQIRQTPTFELGTPVLGSQCNHCIDRKAENTSIKASTVKDQEWLAWYASFSLRSRKKHILACPDECSGGRYSIP